MQALPQCQQLPVRDDGGPAGGAAVVAHVAVLEKLPPLAKRPAVVWVIGVTEVLLA